jgi:hypothetical protein
MKRQLVILACERGFFGQHIKPWKSMDVHALESMLSSNDVLVRTITVEEVAHNPQLVVNSLVFYSSTQRPGYRDYIEDVLLALLKGNNELVPSFDMFRAHENKGFQELIKSVKGITEIPGRYYSSVQSVEGTWVDWPAVLKWPTGAKSEGVVLVRDRDELSRLVRQRERLSIRQKVHSFYRRFIARKPGAREWFEYIRPKQRFVLQRLVPALSHDYKVLVFGDNYFVLRRDVRRGDFRASGSGNFSFVDPPCGLLDYAASVFDRFNEPFLSMDICRTENGFGLIEFQAVHFGPYTLIESPFHFRRSKEREAPWRKVVGKVVLEQQVAEALLVWMRQSEKH